jgi:hypothetical protein
MKKILLLGLLTFSTCVLTSCSFGENTTSKEKEEPSVDSTVYGTGGESETLVVDADIPKGEYVVFATNLPEGEKAYVEVFKTADKSFENSHFSVDFKTTALVQLKAGQVVVGEYCTFQNIKSNPEIGELRDGVFKIGVQVTLKNKVLKLRGIKDPESGVGYYQLYSSLSHVGYYIHPNLSASQTSGTLAKDETVSIPYVEDGAYIEVDGAEIILE